MPDTLPQRWPPERNQTEPGDTMPSFWTALRRGMAARCPVCGKAPLFAGWLRVRTCCAVCAAPLGRIRADDAPPYFTVFIVAHIIIGALVAFEREVVLSVAAELLIFLPATLALTLLLIRPVKGATVGAMMKLGFMKSGDEP